MKNMKYDQAKTDLCVKRPGQRTEGRKTSDELRNGKRMS